MFLRPAKKMQDVPLLGVVPPAHVIYLHVDGAKRMGRLLDLDLESTVRQSKRVRMIE